MDEKLHQRIFDDNLALIDTPLIETGGSASSYNYPGSVSNSLHGVLSYPFNISGFHQRHMAAGASAAAGNESPFDIVDTGYGYAGNGNGNGNGNGGVYYQSMCTCISMNVIN